MKASALGFVSVGALAAALHYVVALLAHVLGLEPAIANLAGFLCAFPLSYFGHRAWSFHGTQAPRIQAFPKFFAVALLGFFGNQAILWAGMHHTQMPFWLVLAIAMVLIAASTFVLSRWWAFKHG